MRAGRLLGELIWAQLHGCPPPPSSTLRPSPDVVGRYPWWPAEVCECLEPDRDEVRPVEGKLKFVFFYGSNDTGFVQKWRTLDAEQRAATLRKEGTTAIPIRLDGRAPASRCPRGSKPRL